MPIVGAWSTYGATKSSIVRPFHESISSVAHREDVREEARGPERVGHRHSESARHVEREARHARDRRRDRDAHDPFARGEARTPARSGKRSSAMSRVRRKSIAPSSPTRRSTSPSGSVRPAAEHVGPDVDVEPLLLVARARSAEAAVLLERASSGCRRSRGAASPRSRRCPSQSRPRAARRPLALSPTPPGDRAARAGS